ncbi:hypothetical protein NDI45_23540 [Leptolyngbya sp. GB1-A1]|uniref:general stress protein n=1 Tax=Leptolyngbya sp. GB1-A1 TaxID=2933908 RepID=UPI003297933D
MKTNNLKQAIGVFPNQEKAEQALLELQSVNFPMHQISVVTKNLNATKNLVDKANQLSITRIEGTKAGAVLGSVGVGLTTLMIGLGVLLVPGVGPALALDSILTAFLGSSVASAAGGLYGAFLGCLDPEKQVKLYKEQVKQGDCLVIIKATETQILSVEPVLRRCSVRSWQVYDLP